MCGEVEAWEVDGDFFNGVIGARSSRFRSRIGDDREGARSFKEGRRKAGRIYLSLDENKEACDGSGLASKPRGSNSIRAVYRFQDYHIPLLMSIEFAIVDKHQGEKNERDS